MPLCPISKVFNVNETVRFCDVFVRNIFIDLISRVKGAELMARES